MPRVLTYPAHRNFLSAPGKFLEDPPILTSTGEVKNIKRLENVRTFHTLRLVLQVYFPKL